MQLSRYLGVMVDFAKQGKCVPEHTLEVYRRMKGPGRPHYMSNGLTDSGRIYQASGIIADLFDMAFSRKHSMDEKSKYKTNDDYIYQTCFRFILPKESLELLRNVLDAKNNGLFNSDKKLERQAVKELIKQIEKVNKN